MNDADRTRIDRTVEIFDAARAPLFTALAGIRRDDFDWQPGPRSRGIGKICRHVYRVDVWFLKRLGVEPATEVDGPDSPEVVAGRMRTIQEQILAEVAGCDVDADLMVDRTSLDGETTSKLGSTVLHIAQHYLYHLAQITYLRRLRDPGWDAPLEAWERATHLIEDGVLE